MTEPLTGARLPLDSDAPLGGTQTSRAITELAPFTNPRFSSTAARDAAYSAFVARGGVMEDGMQCAVGNVQYARANGTWTVMWQPTSGGGQSTSWVTFSTTASASGWAFEPIPGGNFPSAYRARNGMLSIRAALRRTGADLAAPAANGNIGDTPLIDEAIAAMATGHNHYFSGQGPSAEALVGLRLNESGTVDLVCLANGSARITNGDRVVFNYSTPID